MYTAKKFERFIRSTTRWILTAAEWLNCIISTIRSSPVGFHASACFVSLYFSRPKRMIFDCRFQERSELTFIWLLAIWLIVILHRTKYKVWCSAFRRQPWVRLQPNRWTFTAAEPGTYALWRSLNTSAWKRDYVLFIIPFHPGIFDNRARNSLSIARTPLRNSSLYGRNQHLKTADLTGDNHRSAK